MTAKTRTITLASGATHDVPANIENVVGIDSEGRIVVDHFDALADDAKDGAFLFGLTLCCNASDKGVEDGVVCRGCYGYDDTGAYHFRRMDDPSCPFPDVDLIVVDTPVAAPAPAVTEKESTMSKTPATKPAKATKKATNGKGAAAQFEALGIPEADWTDAMRLAVKQRWSNLPVDVKVDDLRASLAAVTEPAAPTEAELVAAGFTTEPAQHDELARRKRNAKVQAWRARKQIQAALDARDLRFKAMRAKRTAPAKSAPKANVDTAKAAG